MTSDEQRAAFEEWIRQAYPRYTNLTPDPIFSRYDYFDVQLAWEAWQASHEHDKNTEHTEHPLRGTTLWRLFEDS